MTVRWQTEIFPVGGTRCLLKLPNGTLLSAHGRAQDGANVFVAASHDEGRSWQEGASIVHDPETETDLGDGSLLRSRTGKIYYAYRHNHYRGPHEKTPDYALRIAASSDQGKSWQPHSTVIAHSVVASEGPSRGLWAPFLFETPDGELQCYYDDEKTPFDAGFRGHQWLMMRTWDAKANAWVRPVVVSRARDPYHLSRDGMGTVVALSRRRLFCALESVQTTPPHAAVVRFVTSEDGGNTWSWQKSERSILYQPSHPNFMSLSPALIRLSDGTLACVFCTDEDREKPDRAGTPPHLLNMDIKLVLSSDGGKTWQPPSRITESHRAYLPGLIEVRKGKLLATWIDFAEHGRTLGRFGLR